MILNNSVNEQREKNHHFAMQTSIFEVQGLVLWCAGHVCQQGREGIEEGPVLQDVLGKMQMA